MNFCKFCVVFAIGACVVSALEAALTDDVVSSYADAFNKYQIKFNKHYGTKEEYNKRLRAYATSMERIKRMNARGDDTATYGETSLSDILDEEFKMMNRAVRIPVSQVSNKRRSVENTFPKPKLAQDHEIHNMPDTFNWLDTPGVNHPAKNQGSCGSCWAFAAAGAIEMQAVLEGLSFRNVSREQCIDCGSSGPDSGGCCGGFPGDAYSRISFYLSEEAYPYVLGNWSQPTRCTPYYCTPYTEEQAVYKIRGYDAFVAMNAIPLKEQIWMYGPISVWMNVTADLSQYTGGIFDCTGKTPVGGHYVVAVGYGPGYFIIRNSWGSDWGMQGNFYISDRSEAASCKMIVDINGRYLQMARVSVDPDSAFRVAPFLAIIALLLFL